MNAGKAAVFLRFVGYTLWPGREEDRARTVCRFCETDFVGANGPGSGKFVSAAALANAALAKWVALVTTHRSTVCSGGERLLQIHTPLIEALHALSLRDAIETNGTLTRPSGIDWICVSPKAGAAWVLTRGNELRLFYPQQGLILESLQAIDFELFPPQPTDGPLRLENTRLAVD
jgi:7-carboxy-7-deazaguanine synthase (Cx14CxxC type)